MICCRVCGQMFLTQREADLCSPRAQWADKYGPATADPFAHLREMAS